MGAVGISVKRVGFMRAPALEGGRAPAVPATWVGQPGPLRFDANAPGRRRAQSGVVWSGGSGGRKMVGCVQKGQGGTALWAFGAPSIGVPPAPQRAQELHESLACGGEKEGEKSGSGIGV